MACLNMDMDMDMDMCSWVRDKKMDRWSERERERDEQTAEPSA